MPAFCVCMEQFESRTLLAATVVDDTYFPAFGNWRMPVAFGTDVHAHLDGKMIHYAFIGPNDQSKQIWRTNPNGSLDRSFASSGVIDLGTAEVSDLEIAPDGKIVTLMRTNGSTI